MEAQGETNGDVRCCGGGVQGLWRGDASSGDGSFGFRFFFLHGGRSSPLSSATDVPSCGELSRPDCGVGISSFRFRLTFFHNGRASPLVSARGAALGVGASSTKVGVDMCFAFVFPCVVLSSSLILTCALLFLATWSGQPSAASRTRPWSEGPEAGGPRCCDINKVQKLYLLKKKSRHRPVGVSTLRSFLSSLPLLYLLRTFISSCPPLYSSRFLSAFLSSFGDPPVEARPCVTCYRGQVTPPRAWCRAEPWPALPPLQTNRHRFRPM